jgi:hypothetical protein
MVRTESEALVVSVVRKALREIKVHKVTAVTKMTVAQVTAVVTPADERNKLMTRLEIVFGVVFVTWVVMMI